MITLEQAKNLTYGQVLHHVSQKNVDGTPQRWRVSGKPKTWKRTPSRVSVPLKHGMYDHEHLTEDSLYLVELS